MKCFFFSIFMLTSNIIMSNFFLVHGVIDQNPNKILKILKDGYLIASYYSHQSGLYHNDLLEYVYFSLLGDEASFPFKNISFILDSNVLYNRSFRYALKWVGGDIDKTIKVNPRFDNVDIVLYKINKHIISIDPDYPGKNTSHEILLKKKVNLHKYLVAICCKSSLTNDVIDYANKHYPNVVILDSFPDSAEVLNNIIQ